MILPLKWFVVLILSSALAVQSCLAATACFVNGVASLTEHLASGEVKITIKTMKAVAGPFKEGFRWGGEDASAPQTLIALISASSGENKLFIPLSAYVDLGSPQTVSLKQSVTGFDLTILGGDAGSSYKAILSFENGWLTRRRVTHGEFPDQAWEETKYSYNTPNN